MTGRFVFELVFAVALAVLIVAVARVRDRVVGSAEAQRAVIVQLDKELELVRAEVDRIGREVERMRARVDGLGAPPALLPSSVGIVR